MLISPLRNGSPRILLLRQGGRRTDEEGRKHETDYVKSNQQQQPCSKNSCSSISDRETTEGDERARFRANSRVHPVEERESNMHQISAILHADGGSRGNPGPSAGGAVLLNEDGETIGTVSDYCGETTNNVAEYRGLIAGLTLAYRKGVTDLDIFLDSELVVKQLSGEFRSNPALEALRNEAQRLMEYFSRCEVNHVSREQNAAADAVVNACLDRYTQVEKRTRDIDRKIKRMLKSLDVVKKKTKDNLEVGRLLDEMLADLEELRKTHGIGSDMNFPEED